jgi:hypothetical protein
LETDFSKCNLKTTSSTKVSSFISLTNIIIQDKIHSEGVENLEIYLSKELLQYKKMIKRRDQENHRKSKFEEKHTVLNFTN